MKYIQPVLGGMIKKLGGMIKSFKIMGVTIKTYGWNN